MDKKTLVMFNTSLNIWFDISKGQLSLVKNAYHPLTAHSPRVGGPKYLRRGTGAKRHMDFQIPFCL